MREMFTDADFFGINFPMDLDVRMKATMLGACFLIVRIYCSFVNWHQTECVSKLINSLFRVNRMPCSSRRPRIERTIDRECFNNNSYQTPITTHLKWLLYDIVYLPFSKFCFCGFNIYPNAQRDKCASSTRNDIQAPEQSVPLMIRSTLETSSSPVERTPDDGFPSNMPMYSHIFKDFCSIFVRIKTLSVMCFCVTTYRCWKLNIIFGWRFFLLKLSFSKKSIPNRKRRNFILQFMAEANMCSFCKFIFIN